MTLNEFVSKYLGKFVEAGGSINALNQCVDIINQYLVEVLDQPKLLGTNAQDFPAKIGSNYDYFLNTPSGVPSPGDIVIFKSTSGIGHISIFIEGTASLFKSFDQNYPLGSPCKIVSHNYTNVLGWLRLKPQTMPAGKVYSEEEMTKMRLERDANWKLYQEAVEDGKTVIEKISIKMGCANSFEAIVARIEAVNKLDGQLEDAISEARKQQELHDQEKADLQRQITELKQEVEKQQLENKSLLDRLERLEGKVTETQKKESLLDRILKYLKG